MVPNTRPVLLSGINATKLLVLIVEVSVGCSQSVEFAPLACSQCFMIRAQYSHPLLLLSISAMFAAPTSAYDFYQQIWQNDKRQSLCRRRGCNKKVEEENKEEGRWRKWRFARIPKCFWKRWRIWILALLCKFSSWTFQLGFNGMLEMLTSAS